MESEMEFTQENIQSKPAPKSKRKRKLIISICVINLLIFLVGLYFFTKPFALSKPDEEIIHDIMDDFNDEKDRPSHNKVHRIDPYTSYEIRFIDFNFFTQSAVVTVEARREYPFWVENDTLKLELSYNGEWQLSERIVNSVTDSRIDFDYALGRYEDTKSYGWYESYSYRLEINSIDTHSNEIDLELSHKDGTKHQGVYPFTYRTYDDGCIWDVVLYIDDDYTLYIDPDHISLYWGVGYHGSHIATYYEDNQSFNVYKNFD